MNAKLQAKAPNRWLVLAAICGGLFIIMMQNTVINLANPYIVADFATDLSTVEWVMTGYMLAFTAFLLTMGRLGDAIGRKKMFAGGLAVYMLGGLLAANAPSVAWLIAFSALQGIGGSAMMPATTSIIAATFDKKERGIAMGIWGAVSGLAVVAGPLIGGSLTEHGLGPAINSFLGINQGWRYIYYLNALIGIVVLIASLKIVPESKDEKASRHFDLVGVALSAISLFLLAFGLINGAKHYGWIFKNQPLSIGNFTLDLGPYSPTPIILLLSLAFGVIFVIRESKSKVDPLLDVSLFKDANFAGGSAVTAILNFAMMGTFFLMPFFLKSVLGMGALNSGLVMIPMAVAVIIVSPIAGKLSDRFGAKWVIFSGMLIMTLACLYVANLSPDTTIASLFLPFVALGIGIGLPMSPITSTALMDVPLGKVGGASGTLSMLRQIGGILGIAIIASLFGTFMPDNLVSRVEAIPNATVKPFVKNMIVEGIRNPAPGSSMESGGTAGLAQYEAQLSDLVGEKKAKEASVAISKAMYTGISDSLNQAFRWAAIVPFLGVIASLFLRNKPRRKEVEGESLPETEAEATAEAEA